MIKEVRMKKEKKIILLNWYIILQPIIDILTSLGVRYGSDSITLGVAIRAVFIAGNMKKLLKYMWL